VATVATAIGGSSQMLKVDVVVKTKCNRHPKFNPAKHGEGAIVANCAGCHRLLSYWNMMVVLTNQLKQAGLPVQVKGIFA
jgi:hypothetical protein